MSKLHELLAVEGDLEGTYRKILEETENKFKTRLDYFFGWVRVMNWYDAEEPDLPKEYHDLTTTVKDELAYQEEHVVRYFDALLQKEATNQEAKADVVIDGVTIAKDLPATFLLGMEARLKRVRDTFLAIPTLPANIDWTKDDQKGTNVYRRTNPEEKLKTEKIFKVQVLYEATREHPAQVEKIPETKNVGVYQKNVWTGVLSDAEKSALLSRINKLIQAVKKARQRANTTEIVERTVGKELFDYINGSV